VLNLKTAKTLGLTIPPSATVWAIIDKIALQQNGQTIRSPRRADFVAEVGLEGGLAARGCFYGRAGTMVLRQPEAERRD
jgi:hypothetical protein